MKWIIGLLVFSLFTLGSISQAHFYDGPDTRVDFTGEGYPFRAIGYLKQKIDGTQKGACTAFLSGPNKITTAYHCLRGFDDKYVYRVHFYLPDTPLMRSDNRLNRYFIAHVPKGGQPYKHNTSKDHVTLELDTTLNGGIQPGELVGYFGITGSELRNREPGDPGSIPNRFSSTYYRDFCKIREKVNFPMEWLYDWHDSRSNGSRMDWVLREEQYVEMEYLCFASFPRDGMQEGQTVLKVQNDCGFFGVVKKTVRHTCWSAPGSSGAPLFYYNFDDGHYYAFAVHSGSFSDPDYKSSDEFQEDNGKHLIGDPFSEWYFNHAAVIIRDVF